MSNSRTRGVRKSGKECCRIRVQHWRGKSPICNPHGPGLPFKTEPKWAGHESASARLSEGRGGLKLT